MCSCEREAETMSDLCGACLEEYHTWLDTQQNLRDEIERYEAERVAAQKEAA